MIKVNILKEKKEIRSIILTGHAGYDEYGKDIVCSGVSSVVTTTINGILTFDRHYISYEQKEDTLKITIQVHNEIVDHLILNMLNLLKEIENDYPSYIKIKEENL